MKSEKQLLELSKTLKQVLIDWEDDDVCSPHRVHHALAGPMAKILERLRNVAWDLEDACALQGPTTTKAGPDINLDS